MSRVSSIIPKRFDLPLDGYAHSLIEDAVMYFSRHAWESQSFLFFLFFLFFFVFFSFCFLRCAVNFPETHLLVLMTPHCKIAVASIEVTVSRPPSISTSLSIHLLEENAQINSLYFRSISALPSSQIRNELKALEHYPLLFNPGSKFTNLAIFFHLISRCERDDDSNYDVT